MYFGKYFRKFLDEPVRSNFAQWFPKKLSEIFFRDFLLFFNIMHSSDITYDPFDLKETKRRIERGCF